VRAVFDALMAASPIVAPPRGEVASANTLAERWMMLLLRSKLVWQFRRYSN
jgi:hypothetical protein